MGVRTALLCLSCAIVLTGASQARGATRWTHAKPTGPKRILTADYLGYGKSQYPWSTYAAWLNWAEVPQSVVNAIDATGIQTILYTNPNRSAPHQPFYTDDESTFAHDCANNRLYFTNDPHIDLMEPSSTDLWDLWANYDLKIEKYAHYTAVLEDTADDILGINAEPCNYTVQQWTDDSLAEDQYLQGKGVNVIYNGLGIYGTGYTISPSIALNPATVGGMLEQCFVRPGNNYQILIGLWKTIENTELQMAQDKKPYFCYADNWTIPSSRAIGLRQYIYASFLLTYDSSTSVLWETFPTPSGFHVNPETGFVALQPAVGHITSIDQLKTTTNTYVRLYNGCYIGGRLLGACAVVVNPGVVNEPWPANIGTFTRTVEIGGSDVLDGGWMTPHGPPPPQTMAPLSGVIALP